MFTSTWETPTVRNYPLYLSTSLVCVWCLEKPLTFISNKKDTTKATKKMVAWRQVEIPFYTSIGQQRGRGFGALAQVIGRTTTPFSRKFVVTASKRADKDLLEISVPKIADVASERKNSSQLQRAWEGKLWENSWVVVAWKRLQPESFQQNLPNKPVGREGTFSQTILFNHVQNFSVHIFCGSFWRSRTRSDCSWRCLAVPRAGNISYYLTPWKLQIVWISNGSG